MNDLTTQVSTLTTLIDRAVNSLISAHSAAEILEASEMASLAYDAAKRTARFLAAKGAHDSMIATVHLAQADALEIEARAKRRLADEYDAAQERGEAAVQGRPNKRLEKKTFFEKGDGQIAAKKVGKVLNDNTERAFEQLEKVIGDIGGPAQLTELRLTKSLIHEARIVRDAEDADPGIVRRTLDEKLKTGAEPTKAVLRKALKAATKDPAGAPARGKARPKKKRKPAYVEVESQHDRDLQMLRGVWEGTCESARAEFLLGLGYSTRRVA